MLLSVRLHFWVRDRPEVDVSSEQTTLTACPRPPVAGAAHRGPVCVLVQDVLEAVVRFAAAREATSQSVRGPTDERLERLQATAAQDGCDVRIAPGGAAVRLERSQLFTPRFRALLRFSSHAGTMSPASVLAPPRPYADLRARFERRSHRGRRASALTPRIEPEKVTDRPSRSGSIDVDNNADVAHRSKSEQVSANLSEVWRYKEAAISQ